jgi:hypothetical protein
MAIRKPQVAHSHHYSAQGRCSPLAAVSRTGWVASFLATHCGSDIVGVARGENVNDTPKVLVDGSQIEGKKRQPTEIRAKSSPALRVASVGGDFTACCLVATVCSFFCKMATQVQTGVKNVSGCRSLHCGEFSLCGRGEDLKPSIRKAVEFRLLKVGPECWASTAYMSGFELSFRFQLYRVYVQRQDHFRLLQ